MSRIRPILIGAVIVAAGLVSINGIAYATIGQGLILGHNNAEKMTTTITDSGKSPALYLKTRSGQAPFRVTSSRQVAHLNATQVDGKSASALQTHAVEDVLPESSSDLSSINYTLPVMAGGSYQVSFDVVARMSAAGGVINCGVEQHGTLTTLVLAYGSSFNTFSEVTGSGIVTSSTGAFDFRCFPGSGTFTVLTAPTSTVTFVKLDSVTTNNVPQPAIAQTDVRARIATRPTDEGR